MLFHTLIDSINRPTYAVRSQDKPLIRHVKIITLSCIVTMNSIVKCKHINKYVDNKLVSYILY